MYVCSYHGSIIGATFSYILGWTSNHGLDKEFSSGSIHQTFFTPIPGTLDTRSPVTVREERKKEREEFFSITHQLPMFRISFFRIWFSPIFRHHHHGGFVLRSIEVMADVGDTGYGEERKMRKRVRDKKEWEEKEKWERKWWTEREQDKSSRIGVCLSWLMLRKCSL